MSSLCSLHFRCLRPADAAALLCLRHQAIQEAPTAFGTEPAFELGKTLGHYRAQLLRFTQRGREDLLGIWQADRLVGLAGHGARRRGRLEYVLIYSMYVTPELRGQGLGAALIHHCCARAVRDWGLNRARLNVETHNLTAWRLYQHLGFREISRETAAFRINGVAYDVAVLEKTPLAPAEK